MDKAGVDPKSCPVPKRFYPTKKYYPSWQTDLDHPSMIAAVEAYRGAFDSEPHLGYWVFSTNGVATSGMHDIPTVGFGPGHEKHAHAPNEYVEIEHLVKAAAFYMSFATEFVKR